MTFHCKAISLREILIALKLCSKLLTKIQPPLINDCEKQISCDMASDNEESGVGSFCDPNEPVLETEMVVSTERDSPVTFADCAEQTILYNCEDSNDFISPHSGIRSIISTCEEKFQYLIMTFIKEKMVSSFTKCLKHYQSIVLPKEHNRLEREKQLDVILRKCLSLKNQPPSTEEIDFFKKEISKNTFLQTDYTLTSVEKITITTIFLQTFQQLMFLMKELASFPTFYTNSKVLYDKHTQAGK